MCCSKPDYNYKPKKMRHLHICFSFCIAVQHCELMLNNKNQFETNTLWDQVDGWYGLMFRTMQHYRWKLINNTRTTYDRIGMLSNSTARKMQISLPWSLYSCSTDLLDNVAIIMRALR